MHEKFLTTHTAGAIVTALATAALWCTAANASDPATTSAQTPSSMESSQMAPESSQMAPTSKTEPNVAKASPTQQQAPAARHWTHWNSMVRDAQIALNKQEGTKLVIDGRLGPATSAALKKYQSDHGLKASGTLDRATQDSLHVQNAKI